MVGPSSREDGKPQTVVPVGDLVARERGGREPGVLIVAHGSRDPAANAELEGLIDRYRVRHAAREIAHGFVELAAPSYGQALAELTQRHNRLVVAPLFLFAAGHVKNDIPLALARLRAGRPGLELDVARPLGVHARMVSLAARRLEEAAPDLAAVAGATVLIVLGRGSSDPDANGDFWKLARLAAEGRELSGVLPAFVGVARPSLEEALAQAARARPKRILVLPYLMFAGRLIERIDATLAKFRRDYAWIEVTRASHLGADDALLDVLDDRIAEALAGHGGLPCETCQYRAPVGAVAQQVGGMEALLWSVRHMLTHSQALPHVHAHRPLKKHVLVCGNADCADRGSIDLIAQLRRTLRRRKRTRDIRVTRTSCMGRCGEGPTVAVYPDGIWYRGVCAQDAEALVDEHLLAGRLVARLVDDIMQ